MELYYWIRIANLLIISGFIRIGRTQKQALNLATVTHSCSSQFNKYCQEFKAPSGQALKLFNSENPNSTLNKKYQVYIKKSMFNVKKYNPPTVVDNIFCYDKPFGSGRRGRNEKPPGIIPSNTNTIIYSSTEVDKQKEPGAKFILQVAGSLGIPVITFLESALISSEKNRLRMLSIAPSIYQQAESMLEIMKWYKWSAFSVITGSASGEGDLIAALQKIVANSLGDWHYEMLSHAKLPQVGPEGASLATKKEIRRVLEEDVKKTDSRILLLHCTTDEAIEMFKIAKEVQLSSSEYVWISTSAIQEQPKKDEPIDRIQSFNDDFPIGLIGMYFDTRNKAVQQAIGIGVRVWLQALENMLHDRGDMSMKFLKPNVSCNMERSIFWKQGEILFNYMKNVSVPAFNRLDGDTLRYKVDNERKIEFNDDGTLKETELHIMNLKPMMDGSDRREWRSVGHWNNKGLVIDDITWPSGDSQPPIGKPLKYNLEVVMLEEAPYVNYLEMDNVTHLCPPNSVKCRVGKLNETQNTPNATLNSTLYKCCSGLCIDLLERLKKDLNFEYNLFQVEDAKWGAYDNRSKKWNGLVRALMDEDEDSPISNNKPPKADLSMTSLKITPERNAFIDFSVPFLETGITIIVAVRDGVISPTAFLEPYDYPSWCLILVFSVHASGAAIFIYEWLSPQGLDRGNAPIREHQFSLFRAFWLIWAMLFGAAVNVDNPRGIASRFMASVWALFAVVFTASYTANLAAFMIAKEDYDRLSGIQDWRLMNPTSLKPPFKFGTVPDGSTEANLKNHHPKMFQYMKNFNESTVGLGIQAVKTGKLNAFLYDATVLEYRAGQDDKCKLRTVGKWYAMTGYGVGFPRNSPWKDKFNTYLLKYQHDGVMERLRRFWLAGACDKTEKKGREVSNPLGILNFTSAFILLGIGMLLGFFILIMEHMYFKFFRAKLRQWDTCGCCALVSLSMGKSLTFGQTVMETIQTYRSFKCKNPICETQMWKIRHELDLALLKNERLQKQLSIQGIEPDKRAVWKSSPEAEHKAIESQPREKDLESPKRPYTPLQSESNPTGTAIHPGGSPIHAGLPQESAKTDNSPKFYRSNLDENFRRRNVNKNLPNSPARQPLIQDSPYWEENESHDSRPTAGRATSPSFADFKRSSLKDRPPTPKSKPKKTPRQRYNNGNYYTEVDGRETVDSHETVL